MKKKFCVLLAFMSLSAFAGTITNRDTGEYVDLSYDQERNTVTVLSSSTLVASKEIKLEKIKLKKSEIDLFSNANYVCDEIMRDYVRNCALIPVYNIPTLAAGIVDIVFLPVKSILKIGDNSNFKKDHKYLLRAIVKDEDSLVSNKRFSRIAEKLN